METENKKERRVVSLYPTVNYGSIKVGPKKLDDAILDIKNETKKMYTKPLIKQALIDKDLATLRDMSNFFYSTNGIYSR